MLPVPPMASNPCIPSPCGPYSMCRPINDYAICTCQPGYYGSAPHCRPECVVSADCPQDKACVNQACVDPCPGTCGVSARCQVVNHNAICTCPPGLVGDPFLRCFKEESKHVYFNSVLLLVFICSFMCMHSVFLHRSKKFKPFKMSIYRKLKQSKLNNFQLFAYSFIVVIFINVETVGAKKIYFNPGMVHYSEKCC